MFLICGPAERIAVHKPLSYPSAGYIPSRCASWAPPFCRRNGPKRVDAIQDRQRRHAELLRPWCRAVHP